MRGIHAGYTYTCGTCGPYISHLRGIHLVIAHYLVSAHCGLYERHMRANSTKMRAINPASVRHTFSMCATFGKYALWAICAAHAR